ncbi:Streptomycin 3''-O-adenylyltransferase [Myxococcus hansupus]|uniref:Streptomycin 3''-O-adenylyltransferase n=1 Tax=Pseudomyxococcus hansupus TaxID=1297742 RepID=A0A0H4XF66_9BACT|nr:Streptomycin 3''-O-adenylyltransferase [Myxococcus hansupus]
MPVEVAPQVSSASEVLRRHLAPSLQAIHLFGSAVEGGLKPRSDVDLLVTGNEAADWRGDERNVVLALARIWFSLSTGGFAPKDVAAQWLIERLPDVHQGLMHRARDSYQGVRQDDLASRGPEVAAFVRFARAAIEGLYLALQPGHFAPR